MVAQHFRRMLFVACASVAACAGDRATVVPPRAEFLIGAADSTFWVASDSGEIHVRGAPLVLTRYDGRFYEVYAQHEDLSYPDALFLGDRLYRRDVLTGDSVVVLADSQVVRFASAYARTHPDERPLAPNEDGEAEPSSSVTAEIDMLDVFGPYLSYEYHLDVELADRAPWHATRQGVVDLRSGQTASVTDLFGAEVGARLVRDARRSFEALRDSVARILPSLEGTDRDAALAFARMRFDERSFTLGAVDGRLVVTFSLPGQGEGPAGDVFELEPLPVDSVSWWNALASTVPTRDDDDNDRWHGQGYHVLARYDSAGKMATISLAGSTSREWPLATTRAPLFQTLWLDDPPLSGDERKALTRAFNHAASYDEGARVAQRPAAPGFLVASSNASHENRQRKSARIFRAHDARACEQHGPCVRRGHSLDDGQDRGDRGIPSQPRQRRDGIDRPGRFSRADPRGRPRDHAGERQLRRQVVHGSRRSCGGGRPADRTTPPYELVLSDLRCR